MNTSFKRVISLCLILAATTTVQAESALDYERVRPLIQTYCIECHGGKKVKAKIDFTKMASDRDVDEAFELWEDVVDVIKHGDMPPKEASQPSDAERKAIADWYQKRFVEAIEPRAGVFRPRRLSTNEFANTLESLLGFKLEVDIAEAEQTITERSLIKKLLPPDPPGASGFKNDTRNTEFSTALWDQYALIIDGAVTELFHPKRRKQLEAYTGPVTGTITAVHAERLLRSFIPRAHRRFVSDQDLAVPIANIRQASPNDLLWTLQFEMKAALMSPRFLYRGALMKRGDGQYPVDDYELAERLSYFLWADMPDEALFDAAAAGKLRKPEEITQQVTRMLASPKASTLAEIFAVEWLTLNEIENVRGNKSMSKRALETQPIEFANYLITENRPLLELIDSRVTFTNQTMANYYAREDLKQIKRYQKPKGVEKVEVPNQKLILKATNDRGGLLTMPGILMMNEGPVIRGTWMLERILGDHLPDPPANVGQVPQNKRGQNLTFRQRFEQHRSNSSCMVCHNKIDPLGFALDNFDHSGRNLKKAPPPQKKKKKKKKGPAKPQQHKASAIDTSGKLPSGETFEDFNGLKKLLVTAKRRKVIRNIVDRTLSYALARKLTIHDRPTVDAITKQFDQSNGGYGDLIQAIATSLPFTHAVTENHKSNLDNEDHS